MTIHQDHKQQGEAKQARDREEKLRPAGAAGQQLADASAVHAEDEEKRSRSAEDAGRHANLAAPLPMGGARGDVPVAAGGGEAVDPDFVEELRDEDWAALNDDDAARGRAPALAMGANPAPFEAAARANGFRDIGAAFVDAVDMDFDLPDFPPPNMP